MSDYDSNYSGLSCPFCGEGISQNRAPEGCWVDDLEDEDSEFFQCQKCEKFFKAELNVYKEYSYVIEKPTKKEIDDYGLIANKEEIIDCPGQIFMWKNLLTDKS